MLNSVVCRTEHFYEPWFEETALSAGLFSKENGVIQHNLHRKVWEWVSITQALRERGKLAAGMEGIGFAVGQEPLASIFAASGAAVLASDLGAGDTAEEWSKTGQHAASLEQLYKSDLISRPEFDRLVRFQPIDMNDVAGQFDGAFDFAWSSCSLEHLGSLEHGIAFIKNSVRMLKPGGVAVHTTEFNLTSDDSTIMDGDTVVYREQDLRRLERDVRDMDAGLAKLDLYGGDHEYDIKADYAPYHANGRQHIKLRIGSFVCTSVLLIIQN